MKVAIITEGFQGTGYGHLTRCLSLYQAFEEKKITPLYLAHCDQIGKKFVPNVNLLQLNWLEDNDKLTTTLKNYDVAIIDSYLASMETYHRLFRTVKKTIYIDDYLRMDYPPGIIVNGTIGAENLPYPKVEKYRLLLGIDYIPLRREFWDIDLHEKHNDKITNVLITFGAQDFRNLTTKVLSFLWNEFPQLNYFVVIPEHFVPELVSNNVYYYRSLNAKEMLNLMLKSDVAIVAGGQTTYELARTGVPTIAIGVATNQKYNLKGWVASGFIKEEIWFDDANVFEKIKRNLLAINKRSHQPFIDGQGARRIIHYAIN